MSHVDDGALHAYLDGALDDLPAVEAESIRTHLEHCEACALRLEEERSLRAEARAILAGGTPDLGPLPSFEEVRARARTGAPSSPMSRLRRLGWAASVVVAAGTGWLLRGSQAPRFSVPESAAVGAVGADVVGADAETTEGVPSPAALDAPSGSAGQATSDDRAAPEARTTSLSAPVRQAEAPAEARADRAANTGVLDEVVAAPATVLGGRGAAAEEKEAIRPSPTADMAGVARPVARLRAEAPSVAAVSSVRAKSAESAALVGFADRGALASVPGLPVIPTGEVDPTLPLGAVRTLQLFRGDTLELIHLPRGDGAPRLERRPGDDRTEVVIPRGSGWLVGRARMPADSLLALLARIPGGG